MADSSGNLHEPFRYPSAISGDSPVRVVHSKQVKVHWQLFWSCDQRAANVVIYGPTSSVQGAIYAEKSDTQRVDFGKNIQKRVSLSECGARGTSFFHLQTFSRAHFKYLRGLVSRPGNIGTCARIYSRR